MRRFIFVCLVAIIASLPYIKAAPVPKRTNAKSAVINANTEQNVKWVQERLASCAHIAILQDKKVAELALVRRYVGDPKDTKELISWLEKNVRIERVPDTKLIRVSFKAGNAREQAAIINVVVDDFFNNQVGSRRDSLTRMAKSIREQLADPRVRSGLTAERLTKAEEGLKEREEQIRTLPALVEHAKAP